MGLQTFVYPLNSQIWHMLLRCLWKPFQWIESVGWIYGTMQSLKHIYVQSCTMTGIVAPCTHTIQRLVVSYTSKNPTIACIGSWVSFRELITKANLFMSPLNIHNQNLWEQLLHLQDLTRSYNLVTIVGSTPPQLWMRWKSNMRAWV